MLASLLLLQVNSAFRPEALGNNPNQFDSSLLSSLTAMLPHETPAAQFQAILFLKQYLDKEQNLTLISLYKRMIAEILVHLLTQTLSEDLEAELSVFLTELLDSNFNSIFQLVLEHCDLPDNSFPDTFLNKIFEKLAFNRDEKIDVKNNNIKDKYNAYLSKFNSPLEITDYLVILSPIERKRLFFYLKDNCKTQEDLLKIKVDILHKIHYMENSQSYFSAMNNYRSALSFILRIDFSLLKSTDESRINQFLKKPYRALPEVNNPIHNQQQNQPSHFWLFCQRHPYLTAIPLALLIVGIFVGGIATAGVLHLLLIAPIALLIGLPVFTAILAQPIKAISKHFVTVEAPTDEIDFYHHHSISDTNNICNELAKRFIDEHAETALKVLQTAESFDEEEDDDNITLQLENTSKIMRPVRKQKQSNYFFEEAISEKKRDYEHLINHFTALKPKKQKRPVRKPEILDESTPLLSPSNPPTIKVFKF